MATVKWDHLVHYVNDLSKSIEVFEEHGLAAFKGGSHKDWGCLLYTSDAADERG